MNATKRKKLRLAHKARRRRLSRVAERLSHHTHEREQPRG